MHLLIFPAIRRAKGRADSDQPWAHTVLGTLLRRQDTNALYATGTTSETDGLGTQEETPKKGVAICEETLARLKVKACAGCPPEVLKAVNMLLQGGADLLRQV
eukprot:symbB.v1.2.004272.t1/scaffold222.1/size270942/14